MSSLMGYTRQHSLHFNPSPFSTSETGVRQAGHARILSKSGSIAIALDVTIAAIKLMANRKGGWFVPCRLHSSVEESVS